MLLLEQDIIKKRQVNKNNVTKFNTGNNKSGKYKVKAIWDNAVYRKESKLGYFSKLLYLIFGKNYLEEENILEPALAVQYLRKLINLFYKDYFDKLTAIFEAINILPIMTRSNIRQMTLK